MTFEAQHVLVTGASRGIGAAIAAEFKRLGARVTGTATAPPTPASAEGLADEWKIVDFADAAAIRAFADWVAGLTQLDACVNNAGINIIKPVSEVTPEDYARIEAINLRAPYEICRAAAGVMGLPKGGRIVNVASIWSCITKPQRTLYTTMKTGIVGMTRAFAAELAPLGILVNAVSPGFVMTDMTRESLGAAERTQMERQIPIGRVAEPVEIARLVAFLCSTQNTYLTGQNLVIDGGFSIV